MIFGLGVDIAEVKRFEKWVKNPAMLKRFFNEEEMSKAKSLNVLAQHYAVRFAAKEAFSKALGTGITGFELKNVYIKKDENGKPFLVLKDEVRNLVEKICKTDKFKIHVSLSHEKEYAVSNVIIEVE